MKSNHFFIFLLLLLASCKQEPATDTNTYHSDIEQWRQNRIASLTRADGWTTLIGLYWLESGQQAFGAAEENEIVFPEKAPSFLGEFIMAGDSVTVNISDSVEVNINGDPKMKKIRLKSDLESPTTYMNYGSLTWYLIERNGKFGIRLKDSLSEQRMSLKEIPHFPVDPNWQFQATLIPPGPEATIQIENILGQTSDNKLEGKLEFTYKDKNYQIAALDGGPDSYFLIIADETTGEETYGGGRYMYVDRVDNNGETMIDFNKAYNPPCVFSVFATCPLPPPENYLPFRITAGEKELPNH